VKRLGGGELRRGEDEREKARGKREVRWEDGGREGGGNEEEVWEDIEKEFDNEDFMNSYFVIEG
jgi:hypothetical protein